jgi:hypothetical protein
MFFKKSNREANKAVRCSFCSIGNDKVEKVISGPNAFICSNCVGVCHSTLMAKHFSGPQIKYAALAEETVRMCVHSILLDVAMRSGLIGDHHYTITFYTTFPGVVLPQSLKERHPSEMTIILQHQFWDLKVNANQLEVTLSYNGTKEKIIVPLKAIKLFYDPSVKFGFDFGKGSVGGQRPGKDSVDSASGTSWFWDGLSTPD